MPLSHLTSAGAARELIDRRAFNRTLARATLLLTLALGLPALALIGLNLFTLGLAKKVAEVDRLIAETHAVEMLLVDLETGVRGYQMTGDPQFLEPYNNAAPQLAPRISELKIRLAAQPGLEPTIRRLDTAASLSERQLVDAVALMREQGQAGDLASHLRSKMLMDATRSELDAVGTTARALRAESETRLERARLGLLVGLALLALIIAPVVFWLRRWFQKATTAYRAALITSQHRAEELSVTLASIGDAVLTTDSKGAVTFLNASAERLMGWTLAEARGRMLAEVFPIFNEETGAVAANPVDRVLRERIIVGLANHTVLRARSGLAIPIEDSAAPILTPEGEMRGVVLVFHDVTAQRESARNLAAASWRARVALEVGGAASWLWDSAHDRVIGDALLARTFGVSLEECLAGASLSLFLPKIHEEDRPVVVDALQRAGKVGEDYDVTYRVSPDGRSFNWVRARGRFEMGEDGRSGRMAGLLMDITATRQADEVLREQAWLSSLRAEISALLASSEELDAVLQRCCQVLVDRLDAAFARVWTLHAGDAVLELKASAGLYTHLDGPHARVPVGQFKIGRIAQNREPHLTNDVLHDPNVSDPEWAAREGMIAFAGYPLILDGRLLGVIALFARHTLSPAVLTDLPPMADGIAQCIERKRSEAALVTAKDQAEAASCAKDDFMATLSHELRTPLNPVLMVAAELSGDESLPEEIREDLRMIERNIALEARLIDDLLDLTRISRGRLHLRTEQCDVHSLIALAADIVRDDVRAKELKLDLQLTAQRPAVVADPARLQQIFWNLLRNAVKFTPNGGQISIRTADAPGGWLRVEVRDTGIGLAPEMVERIFTQFDQGGRENDHRFGGLGLGLTIARMLVALHGGSIRAESAGPGTGATFIVELPSASLHPPSINLQTTITPLSRELGDTTPPLAILLVEDHDPTLQVLLRLLTRAGHRVTIAPSIAEALAAAARGRFDAVVSDLGLPDGTGVELMVQLRDRYGLRGIALSGYGMDDDLRRSHEAGFITHLVKPVDFQQLRRALRSLHESRHHGLSDS